MIRVGIVSIRKEIIEMLHRYVGGVLKDLAVVSPCKSVEDALQANYDLYVVYTKGIVFQQLNEKIPTDRIIPVDLFPMPIGIKRVMLLKEGSHLGVIGGHLWDAVDLLSQLLSCGIRNYRFTTGRTCQSSSMDVDYFLISEECIADIEDPEVRRKMVIIPRSLSAQSISRLIKSVITLRGEEQEKLLNN